MRNRTDIKIDLTFIRHGMTRFNIEKKYAGRTDESLSAEGVVAIKEKADSGEYPKADLIFVSPMLRCLETKQCIYGDAKATVIEEFREMDFGLWEGLSYTDLSLDKDYQAWIDSGGLNKIPGGESQDEFCKRVVKGYERMLDVIYEYAAINNQSYVRVSVVAHGGTVMAVGKMIFGLGYYDGQIKNGECKLWSIT